ncbi:hypothetical protein JCGZ_22063 [Jatropha curcas]|uniref:RNase H type-1 domain-containing protein n=1 Tax=Jatropha curcas TaxID=180498 RepID=A0A067JSR6_JATCU|nr:hypothetical protein JCGZ_22063 [Jatropha curcas]
MDSELWAVYCALCIAWDRGWKKVQIQCDSQVVEMFRSRSMTSIHLGNLLEACLALLQDHGLNGHCLKGLCPGGNGRFR